MISGGDVTLRPWGPSDTTFVYYACQDPDIQRWTRVPTPYRATDATAFVERHARPQPEDDGAFFAIVRTDNGELLGSISFNHIDWAFRTADVGYWIAVESRQQGFAGTALDALVAWGMRELKLVEIKLAVLRGNEVSKRVALGRGFTPCGGDTDEELVFSRRLAP